MRDESHHLLELGPDPLVILDSTGRVCMANPAFVAMAGASAAQVAGAPFADLFAPDDRPIIAGALEALFRGRPNVEFRTRWPRDAGTGFIVWRVTRQGRSAIAAGRETLTQPSPADLERLFHLSLDLICVADMDAHFTRVNPAFTDVLGHSEEELLSRKFLEFVHPEDLAATLRQMDRLAAGARVIDFENRYRCRDGNWKWLAWRALPVVEDRTIYAVARDITQRKDLEHIKDEFVATVSHELRTPLTSIHASLRLLVDGGGSIDAAQRHHLLDVALRNCSRLSRLVNDILDMERLGRGTFHLRLAPVDLAQVVRHALEAAEGLALSSDVRLCFENRLAGVEVLADEGRILQVLANLLSNAIRFSTAGDTVTARGFCVGGIVRVEIEDRGAGIEPEFRERIFERFSQSSASARRPASGSGLGLSIAKALVEAHGGRIGFDSKVGEGATFWFELPVSATPP